MDSHIMKDLEDRLVYGTCKQSFTVKNADTSNLFTRLCSHHTCLHVETIPLLVQAK